jgi:hypothetical protein
MKQYEDNGPAVPKISANKIDKTDKDLERRIKDLTARVTTQQETIDRMHRDIVRLRISINEVSARIK